MINKIEARQLWVTALESGKYKQATDNLQENNNSFCCLGVACKVAEKHGIIVHKDYFGELTGSTLDAQPEVREWLGIKTNKATFNFNYLSTESLIKVKNKLQVYTKTKKEFNDTCTTLTYLNDADFSFSDIAKIIKEKPKGLFYDD